MPLLYTRFQPHQAQHRPCWHCSFFSALIYDGTAAWCGVEGGPRVRPMPAHGYSAWQRKVGADDEPDAVPAAGRLHLDLGADQRMVAV